MQFSLASSSRGSGSLSRPHQAPTKLLISLSRNPITPVSTRALRPSLHCSAGNSSGSNSAAGSRSNSRNRSRSRSKTSQQDHSTAAQQQPAARRRRRTTASSAAGSRAGSRASTPQPDDATRTTGSTRPAANVEPEAASTKAATPADALSVQPGPSNDAAFASLTPAADDASAAAAATADAGRSPRTKRAPSSKQQQVVPPPIEYALNSAVGSYSDPNTCTVYWEEGRPYVQGVEGGSSNGSNRAPGPRPECDAERGLIYGATVRFSDSAALRLRRRAMVVWEESGPHKVLIVKKPVAAASNMLREMAQWLQRHGLQVFVERSVHATEFPELDPFDPTTTQVDFAITLGGDGTVLHLASLFAEDTPLPPVMCFAMGTLGFLTPFDAAQFRSCLARVLAANRKPLYCTLRTRKRCAVLDGEGKVKRVHHILNECVVDRGAFPSSVYLELYIDGTFVTAAEADGLIIATPSGSTAYSMSAGGSMVAPSVPCTLITPLSPHSLSFRPLIIPENADLSIRLPLDARSHARASFDGKHPMRIARGFSVHFQPSLCPLPLINIGSLDTDWYEGITRKLKWNQSIRGVPGGGLEAALLKQAAAAAATPANVGAAQLQPQLSLGGLISNLATAAHNEAKVATWVEEALLDNSGGSG